MARTAARMKRLCAGRTRESDIGTAIRLIRTVIFIAVVCKTEDAFQVTKQEQCLVWLGEDVEISLNRRPQCSSPLGLKFGLTLACLTAHLQLIWTLEMLIDESGGFTRPCEDVGSPCTIAHPRAFSNKLMRAQATPEEEHALPAVST